MPWLNNLSNDASKSFAADEKAQKGASADPALGTQVCARCPEELVLVEFADKPGSQAAFGGLRAQYVNLSKSSTFDPDKLVGVDQNVKSAHQAGRTPPIVVKVSPPKVMRVTLRLVREHRAHGFPDGSQTLSVREAGLSHLAWPVPTATVTTDARGEGRHPGMTIPALGGYKFKVEGHIDAKPFVRSGNSVNVRRFIAVRPVVHYASGEATALAAINGIRTDLGALDIEAQLLPKLAGAELGIREITEVDVYAMGEGALASPDSVKVYKPHAIAVIVGQLIPSANGALPAVPFAMDVVRGADGNFPAAATLLLQDPTSTYTLIPLATGAQVVSASITPGTSSAQPLNLGELGGHNTLTSSLTIDLSRFQSQPPSVTALRIRLSLKAINQYHVGWAHPSHPVIYLNLLSPFTKTLLNPTKAAALMIHELGHKLHLASDGSGSLPDKQSHHYPTMTTAPWHQGPHCSTGVPASTALTTAAAQTAATCTMWGFLKTSKVFCPECKTSLRKVDLSAGF